MEVSKEVYTIHYQTKEQARYQERKKKNNKVFSYHALDTEDMSGEEMLCDKTAPTPEDVVIGNIMNGSLHKALKQLTEDEMALIQALFFDGKSEREWSKKCGIAQKTINDRKRRILSKLKNL